MRVSYTTKLLVAFRSGDRCALPDCGASLTVDSMAGGLIRVGEAAHIAGEHGGTNKKLAAARFDPKMTDEERNSFENLIYLCPTCHTRIDTLPLGEQEYPTTRLLQIKAEHEQRVRDALSEGFADVGFAELEEVTRWAGTVDPAAVNVEFSLTAIEEKIQKNNLAEDSRAVIAMGLGVAGEVARYIESVAQTDQNFPERLTAGFLSEYYRLRQKGLAGDDLFDLMCCFAQRGFKRQAQRSAGLAVLIHLFEACEVFEK